MSDKEGNLNKLIITSETAVLVWILFVTTFLPPNFFSPIQVLTGILLIIFSFGKVKMGYLKIIAPLLIILVTGILGVFNHDSRHILRDISYALTPLMLIFIGFWLADKIKDYSNIFKIIVYFGIIISVIHLGRILIHPHILSMEISKIRDLAPNSNSSLLGLALIIGLFQKRLNLGNIFPKFVPDYIAIPIMLMSFALSFSRTSLVLAIVLSISILGWIGKINLKAVLTIILIVCSFLIIILTAPKDDTTTFHGKLARSLTEIAISDYSDWQKINDNWRGYEAYRAINTFNSGSAIQKIFGQGFGSLVDLGMTMNLSGVDFDKIPILHNGYAYILVKAGLIGLLCYAFFYFRILFISIKSLKDPDINRVLMSRILLGCTLCLILSMYVVGGMAEIHNSEYVLLLGFLLRRQDQLNFSLKK
jgi:hypothetical protein